jgi:hypothetical protein
MGARRREDQRKISKVIGAGFQSNSYYKNKNK